MKIRRLFLTVLGFAMACASGLASPQFIQHRQDCFKAVPTSSEQIIFLGNSITNFHCWADAFARPENKGLGEALISNRGISDERAYHWKHNVQMMLDGENKPAKIFIGIGTNDLNVGLPPEVVVNDIRAIVRQIQISSPATEITVQSILPRGGDINRVVTRTIPLLETMAAEMGVNFINLSETMAQVATNTQWAYDNLHPSAIGYRAWCRRIAPNVGLECAYTDADYSTGGFGAVAGVRAGQYGMMPVEDDDILVIGDPWVDAVQWHEFFGNHNVKNRSICNGNLSKQNIKILIDRTLKGNDKQSCPRAIILCWGAIQLGDNLNADTFKADYEEIVAYAQAAAPEAQIFVCQVPPTHTSATNANARVLEMSVPAVNLEAKGMTASTVSTWNMSGGLGSKGALKAAQAVGELLNAQLGDGTARIVSDAEFEEYYTNRNRRIEVAKCYNALYQHRLANSNDINTALTTIEEILAGNTVSQAQVNEATKLRNDLIGTLRFKPEAEKWYHLSAPRGYESASASVTSLTHNNGIPSFSDLKLSSTTSSGADIWQFGEREDGTYDIVNYDGYYITPTSSPALSKSRPAKGWTIGAGYAETGTYTISCGSIYLHRGAQNNLINYWRADDTGSHFYITEYTGKLPSEQIVINSGWIEITIESGYNAANCGVEGKSVINHNPGILRSNGYYELTVAGPEAGRPATAFLHLTKNQNGTWTVNGLCGHNYDLAGVAHRNVDPQSLSVSSLDDGQYTISNWIPFMEGQTPMIGKSGSNVATYTVNQANVENYDIWAVNINAVEAAFAVRTIQNDTKVTLDIAANKGLPTVYNGGHFFLDKGTVFSSADLKTECGNLSAQKSKTPVVTINDAEKTITIDYNTILAESITINKSELSLKLGESSLLTATVLPENATDRSIDWSSADETVATVDPAGNVTAVSVGTTTVTATCATGLSATCTVTVEEDIEDSIRELYPSSASVKEIYDLQGRRVASPTKGIYIINGTKVTL